MKWLLNASPTQAVLVLLLGGPILWIGASPLQAASPQLKVIGNQIVTANGGCPVRLVGVDTSGLEYSPTGDQGTGYPTTLVDGVTMTDYVSIAAEAITAWHANFIRVPTNQDYWFGCSNSNGTPNTAAYHDEINAIVNYCRSQNAYVDFDLHWSGTSGAAAPPCGSGWGTANGQQCMPDMNAVTFWSSVASVYANDPVVLFDLFNEPFDPSGNDDTFWNIWRNGGPTGSTPANTPGLQGLLNAVRGAGANNICLVGGLQWAYDERALATGSTNCGGSPCGLTDYASSYGIMITAHIYPYKGTPAAGTYDPWVTLVTNLYPVDVEEFGATSTDPANWDNNLLAWMNGANANSYVYNGTGWCFSSDVGPTMLDSFAGYVPNAYHGIPVSTWLNQQYATTTPCGPTWTPNLSNTPTVTPTITNTPSATGTPTSTFSPTVTDTPNPCAQVYEAVNCGGPQTLIGGVTWLADQAYAAGGFGYVTAGNVGTTSSPIANSGAQQPLYQDERYAPTLEYKFTVPNGNYLVTLKNVELYWTSAGKRIFSVAINGVTVIPNLDLFAQAGQYTADDHNIPVSVTGGLIDIVATATADNAEFTAIEVTSDPVCTPTNTPCATATPSPTLTPTSSATYTPTVSPTYTVTATATLTPAFSATPTATLSPTGTPTPAISVTGFCPPYPNPCDGTSPVSFCVDVPEGSLVNLGIYTTAFRKIYGRQTALSGQNLLSWDLRDDGGTPAANGVYYLRIQVTGTQSASKIFKIVVAR